MDRTKSLAAGVAWLIAAALQIIPATWPLLLRPHPWTVGFFILLGAAMFAYASFGRKTPEEASIDFAGRDNSGTQVYAPNSSFHIGDQIPFGVEDLGNTPPLSSSSPKARVRIVRLDIQRIEMSRMNVFGDSPNGSIAAVVWIKNERAPLGEVGAAALSIGVSLTFRKGSQELYQVNRTFWIDHHENEISLAPETRARALIGMCYGDIFGIYENKTRHAPQFRTAGQLIRALENTPTLKPQYIPFSEPTEIEVSVVGSHHETMAEATFLLTPKTEIFFTWERTK